MYNINKTIGELFPSSERVYQKAVAVTTAEPMSNAKIRAAQGLQQTCLRFKMTQRLVPVAKVAVIILAGTLAAIVGMR